MLWCEMGTCIPIYPQGSPTLARAAQTADGDLKCEYPVLHLTLFPGSGAIPWAHFGGRALFSSGTPCYIYRHQPVWRLGPVRGSLRGFLVLHGSVCFGRVPFGW
jgi:hypothetical protein